MARKKAKGTELSVFKGREAKLNRAVILILAFQGSLTIYDLHKQIRKLKRFKHIRYASVNKRMRILEKQGYVCKLGSKQTKAGFEATIYEPKTKAYLALLLSSLNLEDLLARITENKAEALVGILIDIEK